MTLSTDERIAILEEVLEKMSECADMLRRLNDPRIEAYCLADFEGRSAAGSAPSCGTSSKRPSRPLASRRTTTPTSLSDHTPFRAGPFGGLPRYSGGNGPGQQR